MKDVPTDVDEAYRDFVYACEIISRGVHTGSPSVTVDVIMRGTDGEQNISRYSIMINIYTGTALYELVPKGWFITDDDREVELFRFVMKDVCTNMMEDGTFDALLQLHEL